MKIKITPLLAFLMLLACIDSKDFNIDSITSEPDIVFPLTYGDLTLHELVKRVDSSKLKTDADKLLYIESISKSEINNVINKIIIPDVENDIKSMIKQTGSVPAFVKDTPLTTPFEKNITITINPAPADLDEIKFKKGTLTFEASIEPKPNPDTPAAFAFEFKIPALVDEDGNEMFVDKTKAKVGDKGSISLENYTLKMPSANAFTINYTPIRLKSGSLFLQPGSILKLNVHFKDMEYKHIKGYFGFHEVKLPQQTIYLDVLDSTLNNSGTIQLSRSNMNLEIENDFGFPSKFTFQVFQAIKGKDFIDLVIDPISPLDIKFPKSLEAGEIASTMINIINSDQIVSFNPEKIIYSINSITNFGAREKNFLTDTSKIKITYTSKIPLDGIATGVTFSDTLKLDFENVTLRDIEQGALQISSENELPIKLNAQFYLADSSFVITDSLFASPRKIVESSEVKITGELKNAGIIERKPPIILDNNKLDALFESPYIIIKAILDTSSTKGGQIEQVNVKFYENYKLKFQIGLSVKLKIMIKK